MKRIFLTLFSVFLIGMGSIQAKEPAEGKPATLKVLLKKNVDGALLEVKGPFLLVDITNGKRLTASKNKRYFVYPTIDGIKWGDDYSNTTHVRVLPDSPDTTILLGGIQYRGALDIFCADDLLSFVNEVDVESYLKVTLAGKFPKMLGSAVLDSVSIVARTDAYYKALSNYDAVWHVKAEDVGYTGYSAAFSDIDMDRSIENTKYLVMTFDSQPFPTTWNANCAGKTASYSTVFRKNIATPKGVQSEFALKDRSDFHWSFTVPSEELAQVVKTNRISEVELFVDQKSNKVYGIRVKDGHHTADIDFVSFQKALGEQNIRSNDFVVQIKNGKVIFDGYGEGAGVGLCLYTASQLSGMGELAPRILGDFYPLTVLEKMRSYPEMIITHSKDYFVSPRKQRKMIAEKGEEVHGSSARL